MLHWLAQARAALVPPAARPGAVLVDVGCGAGLLAPHVDGLGYRLVGVDLTRSALVQAAEHGVTAVQGDASVLPLADGCADVVCAGEILEHVVDLRAAVREACRVLRPGGVLVVDTIAATFLARLLVITVAERIPRAAPPGLHDPVLFVDREVLISECARHGVRLQLNGLRPGVWSLLRWLRRRQPTARMVRTWSTAVLFQGRGTKENRPGSALCIPRLVVECVGWTKMTRYGTADADSVGICRRQAPPGCGPGAAPHRQARGHRAGLHEQQ